MQIAVSGKFSTDHFDAGYDTQAIIRDLLRSSEIQSIDTALDGFVFLPVIISDEFGIDNRSHRSYSRKENAEFVSEEIDVAKWEIADDRGRLVLMVDALERAIRGTRSSRLHDDAKEFIIRYVRHATEVNGS